MGAPVDRLGLPPSIPAAGNGTREEHPPRSPHTSFRAVRVICAARLSPGVGVTYATMLEPPTGSPQSPPKHNLSKAPTRTAPDRGSTGRNWDARAASAAPPPTNPHVNPMGGRRRRQPAQLQRGGGGPANRCGDGPGTREAQALRCGGHRVRELQDRKGPM